MLSEANMADQPIGDPPCKDMGNVSSPSRFFSPHLGVFYPFIHRSFPVQHQTAPTTNLTYLHIWEYYTFHIFEFPLCNTKPRALRRDYDNSC